MFKQILFILLAIAALFVSPAVALFGGIAFALIFGSPYLAMGRKISKFLLQASVVGLGFGMNLHSALAAGKDGMVFTVVSVIGVMVIGYFFGRYLGITKKMAYLVSAGTAICGGSAIAAVAPVVKADENETSVSLSVIFTLNAVALFTFPYIGHLFGLTEHQFGTWAAIAIHDTSSVVGAGAAYGPEALLTATTVKMVRALWIIPLALVSVFFFPRTKDGVEGKGSSITIPWFIFLFILAMVINTYLPLPKMLSSVIADVSHRALSVTLFLIGSALSLSAIKAVGFRPIILGVGLWIIISTVSLIVILS